jgi:exodeoxyribonuclease-3
MTRLKLLSWNVNGIRAAEKKGFCEWVKNSDADIIGLQETKAHQDQLSPNLLNIEGYSSVWKLGEKKGYSGVAIYSRLDSLNIISEFPAPILNAEGRLLGLEFEKFFYFNGYFPNGGRGMDRVQYKLDFYQEFFNFIEALPKPVIFCGDINTAHHEIDLARPEQNRHTSGFMDIERDWLHFITKHGYIDTFRHFNKGPENYTWWDMKTRSRDRNIGWRIDYFFVSKELEKNLINAQIHANVPGSDHAPISLEIEI